jgi:hypothetical protein
MEGDVEGQGEAVVVRRIWTVLVLLPDLEVVQTWIGGMSWCNDRSGWGFGRRRSIRVGSTGRVNVGGGVGEGWRWWWTRGTPRVQISQGCVESREEVNPLTPSCCYLWVVPENGLKK